MPTIRAIFENGIFRPLEPVDLPEGTLVAFEVRVVRDQSKQDLKAIFSVLDERYDTGETDLAARHDEHQP